ncbi:MAG: hypothetical protein WCS27_05690 [Victivallaceae bacterium]
MALEKIFVRIVVMVMICGSASADPFAQTAGKQIPEKMRIGILAPHPNDSNPKRRLKGSCYEKWLNAVKEAGYDDVRVVNTREIQLAEDNFVLRKKSRANRAYSNEPAVPLTKINTLIIPDTWMHYGVAKTIEKFIENGGRVIATRRAGYLDGQFFLTKALRIGKHNENIPIFYTYYCENNPKYLKTKVKYALENGANGFSFFNYYDFAAKPVTNSSRKKWFANFPPDAANPGLKKIFEQSFGWRKAEMPGLYGTPDFPRAVYLWASYLAAQGAEKVVARLKELNINIVMLNVFKGFGEPAKYSMIYRSRIFAEMCKNTNTAPVKSELFDKFYKLCKKENINIWVWGAFSPNYNFPYSPEKTGFAIGADGLPKKHICVLAASKKLQLQRSICIEFSSMYPELSVYVPDEPHMPEQMCFCPKCRKLFKQKYGRELTVKEDATPDYKEFQEYVMAEYYFKPLMNELNKINPYTRLALALWSEYELSAVNMQKVSDLGVAIWMPENSNPPYYSEGMYYDVENSRFYLDTEHIGSHRVNWFIFSSLFAEQKDSPLLNSLFMEFPAGSRGVKLDMFNGARVHAWMKNPEGNRYPAVVTANAGRTVYFSFDPFIDNLPEKLSRPIVKNVLKWLDAHPFLMDGQQ